MPGYVIYLDAWILRMLANFIFELLLLWSVSEVTRTQTTRKRLVLGAMAGTLHYLLFLMSSYRLIPYYGILRSFPMILLTSFLMILVTFYPKARGKQVLSILAYFYGIGFVSAGAGMAAAYVFGSPIDPQNIVGMLVSIAVMLIIAELGWGIIQRKIYEKVYHLPIKITLDDKCVEITALVDTGNKLKDPLTNQLVVVAEHKALLPLFDQSVADVLYELEAGNLDALNQISASSLAVRLRVIPFNTIGKTNGMLVGFRPDGFEINRESQAITASNVIIAVYKNQLDQAGNYQALIPLELLDSQSTSVQPEKSLRGGEHTHATSTQSKS